VPSLQTIINEAIGLGLVALALVLLFWWRARRTPPDDE
jgi:hypothetical protein